MNLKLVQLFAAITLCLVPHVAVSYVYKGRPNCPEYYVTHNWKDYLQGKYGDATRSFSIRFDHLKAAIGTLVPNTCYTVVYESGRWATIGRDDTGSTGRTPTYSGANPAELLMNIRGVIMKFNQFGQVLYQGEVIGTLKCGIGPDC